MIMAAKCVDVSAWQGTISVDDWRKVKNSGIDSVILRCSYTSQSGFSLHKDKVFKANIRSAVKAGMKIGIYHYSQAISEAEARKEAAFVLRVIRPWKKHITLPVAFDWEFGGRLSAAVAKRNGKTKNTAICNAFCSEIKAAGYDTMVYANLSTLNHYLSAGLYKKWKIWVAQYASRCDYSHPYYLWQYTSSASVPGLSGRIDVSVRYKSGEFTFPPRGYYKKGDKGDGVKAVQRKLNEATAGAYGYKLSVDGEYGDQTVRTCKFLQEVRHIEADGEFGKATLAQCNKKLTPAMMAVNWAVSIAKDGSFAYGVGDRAHHNGCYFCGTNITGPKHAKKGTRWNKTYCCNPFIHAAYAHGAGIPAMLTACKAANAAGLKVGDWKKFGFKNLGKCSKIPYTDLQPGDVVLRKDKHVWMYTGDGYLVEASGEGWGADTIAHKHIAKSKYAEYARRGDTYVLRYRG